MLPPLVLAENLNLAWEPSFWPHPNHHKNATPIHLLSLLFQASSHLLGSRLALLESFIMWGKSFHTLSGSVWCHQSQHRSRILCGLHPVSSVSRPFSPSPYLLVYWSAICRASSGLVRRSEGRRELGRYALPHFLPDATFLAAVAPPSDNGYHQAYPLPMPALPFLLLPLQHWGW